MIHNKDNLSSTSINMTLSVCVGASGSGKTTFLNDVYRFHKCTYIRQYHNLRPYIKVTSIPNFDPTQLPYWDTYIKEKKDKSIIVGGTIGGQFLPGLSGGQRKVLLFELIFQRTAAQDNLLIVLDEPFAGVTDDFIPYIIERLNEMRKKHNILLVTNDHVDTLKRMADNTITVSTLDRSSVKINDTEGIDRELAILAMSIGDEYTTTANNQDTKFFWKVEMSKYGGIWHCLAFAVFAFGLFVATYWDSQPGSEALVIVAAGLVSFFVMFPYFLQIGDWRIYMLEESEALLHSSRSMNKFLKSCVIIALMFVISIVQYYCINAVIGTLSGTKYMVGIIFDTFSIMNPIVLLGLYTNLTDEEVQMFGSVPYLMMVFFSTTFSPSAGIEGLKALRYLFPRYYLWCMLPSIGGFMEGCPAEENTLMYLVLSAFITPYLFCIFAVVRELYQTFRTEKKKKGRLGVIQSAAYAELQIEMFGKKRWALKEKRGSNLFHPQSDVEP